MKESQLRTTFFLALLAAVGTLLFFMLRSYLPALAIAATAAVILHPVYTYILKLVRGQKIVAALLVVVLTFLLVLVPLMLIGIQVASEAADLYAKIRNGTPTLHTNILGSIGDIVQRYLPNTSLDINQYAGESLKWIASNIQSVFAGTVRTIFLFFIGTIAYYYLLKDGANFVDTFMEVSPFTKEEDKKLVKRLRDAMNSVIRGSLIIATLQGTVAGIGLSLFGVPSAVLLGSMAAVAALVPTVGTALVFVPVVLYFFITQDYFAAVGLTLWGTFAIGLIDNFLYPILVGRSIKIHPLFVFFAVLGGISFFGMSGFILGPLIMSMFFGLLDIFRIERKS